MIEIMLIVLIIISAGAILGGYYMRFKALKDKDMKMGVLTQRAKASSETWEYANRTCGSYWLIIGIIGFIMTVAVFLLYSFIGDNWANVFAIFTLAVICIGMSNSCTAVIKELNSKFDEKGNLKENVAE